MYGQSSQRGKVVLNPKLAAEIYEMKLTLLVPDTFQSCLADSRLRIRGKSAQLSNKYGVSAKTIRDIWSRRTWTNATCHLWDRDNYFVEVISRHWFSNQRD